MIIQKQQRLNEHSHQAAIFDFVKEIWKKQIEDHEIIMTIDCNAMFQSHKGGIAKLCRTCSLFDSLAHWHDNEMDIKLHIRGTE